jgi:hypothetical protein
MKKILLIPFLLLLFVVTSGQSEQHFKIQKRLICKYKWTHNEKYFQQYVENWKKEVPEISDSVVANWTLISQNSYQVFQAIFDSTCYLSSAFPNYNFTCLSHYFPHINDTSYLMIPYELKYEILRIKIDSVNLDSVLTNLTEISNYYSKLTFFKPHIEKRKTLYLTEGYKKILLKNRVIFKKLNFNDYNYFREKAAETKRTKKDIRKGIRKYRYKKFYILEDQFNGSILANVVIRFDKTFTYAFLENQNDFTIFICQKKENKWYVIGFIRNSHTQKSTIIVE